MKKIFVLLTVLFIFSACQAHDEDYVFLTAEEIAGVPDGVYEGSVKQGLDQAEVRVTMEGGKIVNFEIISVLGYDWREQAVRDAVPTQILTAQSLDIDGVTEATGSVHGVKIAASEALRPALFEASEKAE